MLVLSPATSTAWNQFVEAQNARMLGRLNPGGSFLWVDEEPNRLKAVRAGEVFVEPLIGGGKKIPGGLIHHWIGAIFVPDTKIDDVLRVVRDYPRYRELYQPSVAASRALSTAGTKDRFSTLMVNRAFLLKSAFETDYESRYVNVDDRRSYSFTWSTRIQEIEQYGMAGQHTLPEGEGSGIMWRLFSVTRYAERDHGVYVEVEAMGLTRDIPGALHWVVDPIVRRVSRNALTISLRQTEKASRSGAEVARLDRERATTPMPTVRGGVFSGRR